MRTFIALELPAGFADEVALLSRSLARRVEGRFVRQESHHLTLAFLGDVDETQLRRAMDAMDVAGADRDPIALSCNGLGTFGRKGDVTLWLGLAANDALEGLAASLRDELAQRSIPFDRKKFVPHITLARRARVPKDSLDGLPFPLPAHACRMTLFKSTLAPDGAIYKPLYTANLAIGPKEQPLEADQELVNRK